MSGKKLRKKLVQRSEQRVQEDRMARQDDSCKETAAVVSVSVVLGAIIAVVDFFAQYGVDLLIK